MRTSDLASNAVTSAKIRNGSLLPADFRAGTLPAGAPGPKGDTGAAGPKGDKGDTGTGRFLRTGSAGLAALAMNTAGAANGGEMLGAHSCKQTAILYDSGNAPAGDRVLTFLSDGSPNGLVATPLIQAATQTNAPIRVSNIMAAPIDIDVSSTPRSR